MRVEGGVVRSRMVDIDSEKNGLWRGMCENKVRQRLETSGNGEEQLWELRIIDEE
jgi:hypothetical protein